MSDATRDVKDLYDNVDFPSKILRRRTPELNVDVLSYQAWADVSCP